jgi:hypothetical protein
MVGATLGVALLGAIFAMFAGHSDGAHVVGGLPLAFIVGGIGEMLGAVVAFTFIRRDSLHPIARPFGVTRGTFAPSRAPRDIVAARDFGRLLPKASRSHE